MPCSAAGSRERSAPRSPRRKNAAARIAAAYSRGANSSQVPVDYTLRKYVRKPGGAKPGFVIYTHQRTLYVTPERRAE